MGIGVSIFLIAVGAILAFGVTVTTTGIDISTIGAILMVVGGIGLLWSLIVAGMARTRYDRFDGPVTEYPAERHTTVIRER
jgi:hypothetical protein